MVAEALPPFAPEWLQAEEMMGGMMTMPPESIDQMRERFRGIWTGVKPMFPLLSHAVLTKGIDYAPGWMVRIYVPVNRGRELPVGPYIDSGGWCSGDIEQDDFLCREVVEKCRMRLYSPEYRLAPENPYPFGLEDVCAAYEFMHNTACKHGGDPNRMYIMGGSAGGNLAASVALVRG